MNIIRKPSPNFYPNRRGEALIGICNHISAGTLSSMDAWFHNPASNASSNFGIGRDGTIHQYIDLENGAWTQGLGKEAIPYATSPLVRQMGINPNLYLASIEHEGYEGHGIDGDLTEEQFKATCYIHKYIQDYALKKWNHKIELNSYYVIGHCMVDPRRKPFCPGERFPWSRLYRELALANDMSLEAYEEHLQYSSSISGMRADLYAFFERMSDLDTKYRGSKYSAEAARKIMLMEPVMYDLGLREEAAVESIIKRVSEIKKVAIVEGKWHDEGIRKASIGASYAKECGIL